jgi:CRISPR-associated protein Csb2
MTLALRLELLGGRYIATSYNDRARAEWPPHPARLFSALVDAWASGEPGSGEGEAERMALVWLERQAPPSIAASGTDEVGHRSEASVFVPVNDISIVRDPDAARTKLEAAEAAMRGGDAKAAKDVEKLRKKLADETAKALAAPAKFSASDLVAADKLLPEHRTRQARMFPSVTPHDPIVTFCWSGDPEAALRAALARLASRLTRLGHSSSLVVARLVDAPAAPRYVPDADGELILRAVGAGQMDRLIAAHHRHQGVESRVLPCAFVRYREGAEAAAGALASSVFDDEWIVFARRSGPRLPSTSTVGVAHQLRRALFAGGKTPMSAALSGHREDGSPAEGAHLAVVPLPDVGGPHPHGAILGVALVIPRGLADADRATLMRAIGELERRRREELGEQAEPEAPTLRLLLGSAGELELERVVWGEHQNLGLRALTWCRPSRTWGTATPIALDRNPGDLHHEHAAKRERAFVMATELVAEAVGRIGLPSPIGIDVLRSCVVPGTAKPNQFPRYPISASKPQRVLVHARLVFEEPVRGPMLLGAGRYLGLGLCRPLDEWARGRAP